MAIEHSSVVSSLSDFFILFKNNSSVFKFCKTFLNLVKSYFKYYVYSLLLFVNLSNTFLFEIFSYIFVISIYVTDDRPYMMILDLIRPFRSYMVRPYMV